MSSLQDLAGKIIGSTRLEESTKDAGQVRTFMAKAMSDSENGTVKLDLDGDVIAPEGGDTSFLVPTLGDIREGDDVFVMLHGSEAARTPTAIAAIGGGDRTRDESSGDPHFWSNDTGVYMSQHDDRPTQQTNVQIDTDGNVNFRYWSYNHLVVESSGRTLIAGNAGCGDNDDDYTAIFEQGMTRLGRGNEPHFFIGHRLELCVPELDSNDEITGWIYPFEVSSNSNSMKLGDGNAPDGQYSAVIGEGSYTNGDNSLTVGTNNTISNIVPGTENNPVQMPADNDLLVGEGLRNTGENQLICGQYNDFDAGSDRNDPVFFAVGSGTSGATVDKKTSFFIQGDSARGVYGDFQQAAVLYEFQATSGAQYPFDSSVIQDQIANGVQLSDSMSNYDEVEIYYITPYPYLTGSIKVGTEYRRFASGYSMSKYPISIMTPSAQYYCNLSCGQTAGSGADTSSILNVRSQTKVSGGNSTTGEYIGIYKVVGYKR